MDLKKLMTGANPQTLMLEQTRGLKAKWEKTGLLENAGSETTKHGMAVMLENQAKQLLDEATRTGTSSGSEEWAGVALPLVRRIFGSIAAKEFVSVQPMNLPSGLIFYMDFKYGTNPAGNPDFTGSSLFGKSGTFGKDSLDQNTNKLGSTQAAEGGLYGPGRFGYTINNSTAAITSTFASASLADIDYDLSSGSVSASFAGNTLKKIVVPIPADADWNGITYGPFNNTLDLSSNVSIVTTAPDGQRIFYVKNNNVWFADWNGTNYTNGKATLINTGAIQALTVTDDKNVLFLEYQPTNSIF